MLTHLHLKNFKGWRDTGPVPLKPLTILFGTNSGGKSSLGQFFMMLKQTVEAPDRKLVLNVGDDKSPVNLGSYDDFIFHRDPKNKLSFSFKWKLGKSLAVERPDASSLLQGDFLQFSAELGKGEDGKAPVGVNNFEYHLGNEPTSNGINIGLERIANTHKEYKIRTEGYELKRKQGRAWTLGAPMKFYGFPDEARTYYQDSDFLLDLSLGLEGLFKSIYYLGPLRSRAERLYPWSGGEPESVGYSGEQTISALLAAQNRMPEAIFNYRKKSPKRTFAEVIAQQLKILGVINDFKVESIAGEKKLYEVKVRISKASDWVDLPDVGFGVSQVLPVIVQSFYAPENSILFIEQPELHLHPRAQANLADVLIDALNSRKEGRARNLQLIIETHSEHFLNRLQRRIAENDSSHEIKSDQVAAYFADVVGQESKLTPLDIDLYGNILNWPENFFGDSMGELMSMQQAAAKRRINDGASRLL